jgi:hypothetical protein
MDADAAFNSETNIETIIHTEPRKELTEILQDAGVFVANHMDLFNRSIAALEEKPIAAEDIVAYVGKVPISIQEIRFRKGLAEAYDRPSDNQTIFNILVEEKLLLNHALEHGIQANDQAINDYIEDQKSMYNEFEEARTIVDAYCSGAKIEVEEYWSTFEYYYALRVPAFGKASEDIVKIGGEQYYHQTILKMKDQLKIIVNKNYRGQGFDIDRSKLYL